MPQYGAACALWPLFQALGQPGQVLYQRVRMPGRTDAVFDCFAAAEPIGPAALNTAPLTQATMLIVPVPGGNQRVGPPPRDVGAACRICPVGDCTGRREPSILSDGF